MADFRYRLQVLLDEKIRARDAARQIVVTAERVLALERSELEDCKRMAQTTLCALRTARLLLLEQVNGIPTGASVPLRLAHIERLAQEQDHAARACRAQELRVQEAQENVERCYRMLAGLSRSVEVLQKHCERQKQKFNREAERLETLAQEEMANIIYLRTARRP